MIRALTITPQLGVGEHLTCTLERVETRASTSRMIADFLGARNTQILANQPGFSRRWARLNGGQGGQSSLTTSLLGFSHQFDSPFQAAFSEREASFAASLSGFSGGDQAISGVGSWDIWSEGRIARFDDSSSDNGLFAIVHGGWITGWARMCWSVLPSVSTGPRRTAPPMPGIFRAQAGWPGLML